jgi:hypothetical protein
MPEARFSFSVLNVGQALSVESRMQLPEIVGARESAGAYCRRSQTEHLVRLLTSSQLGRRIAAAVGKGR